MTSTQRYKYMDREEIERRLIRVTLQINLVAHIIHTNDDSYWPLCYCKLMDKRDAMLAILYKLKM